MQSKNKTQENLEKLIELFPNAITETVNEDGEVVFAIDKDILAQEINTTVVSGREERYQFTWPDKRKTVINSNKPTTSTLRPCKEESVDFDTTENLYIEGDNLEVLKILQETYLGKVKMIYIDPPYNTSNDFIYNDDFTMSEEDYNEISGDYDEDKNRLILNKETNGRFHTDWLNMMYPRLKVAKDLLTDDGIIFISISDKEFHNLRKVCDEIFGHINFIATLIWDKNVSAQSGIYKVYHEYILCYCKNVNNISIPKSLTNDIFEASAIKKISGRHPATQFTFPKGTRFNAPDGTEFKGEFGDTIKTKIIQGKMIAFDNKLTEDITLECGFTQSKQMQQYFYGNRETLVDSKGQKILEFFFNSTGKIQVSKIRSVESPQSTCKFGTQASATQELCDVFNIKESPFSSPKPTKMIIDFIRRFTNDDDIILDFFSGSSTTAEALLNCNIIESTKRKFILVQIAENLDESLKVAQKDAVNVLKSAIEFLDKIGKPHLLSEIGKERIRLAGAKIKEEIENSNKQITIGEEEKQVPDIGFRVLKVDSSNMDDVFYSPDEVKQTLLGEHENNVKSDRTSLDLIFQVMLDLGILLSSEIEEDLIEGKTIYIVDSGVLIACFDKDINEKIITEIAKKKPEFFVMCDSSLKNDSIATNFDQIFESYSPTTKRRII